MANPLLTDSVFLQSTSVTRSRQSNMQRIVFKTFFILFITIGSASWTWYTILQQRSIQVAIWYLKVGTISGFITAIFTVLIPRLSPITAPLYALFKGAFLGALSLLANSLYPGIILQALPLTASLLFAMLFLYTTRIIKPTKTLYTFLSVTFTALLLTILLEWVLKSFFNIQLGILYGSTPLSIGVSIFLVIIGCLSLITDFHFIEEVNQLGLPRYMEWYAAFGLLSTLLWLYLHVLLLLIKLQNYKRR